MSLELVIFDVDGLLLNTERVWQDVWCDVAESYGISEWTQESFLHEGIPLLDEIQKDGMKYERCI